MENKVGELKFGNTKQIISINNLADNYNLKGLKYLENSDFENAITCFFQALNYDNNYAHAYSNIGNALLLKGNYDEAVNMFLDAINLDQNNSLYHYNLGVALTQCNDNKGAVKAYKECLKLDPKNLKAIKYLGNCYNNLKMYSEALKTYRKWEKIDPLNPEPSFLQGQIHIRHGRFNIGWNLYEYGLKNNIRKPFDGYYSEKKSLWDGKTFSGCLLVYGEQGIGDQLNFGTLLPELLEQQKNVIIKVNEKLVDIFSNSFPEIQVYPENIKVPENIYDKYISLGSLCKFYRKHTNKFVNSKFNKYRLNNSKELKIKSILSKLKGFKIGISWHSFSEKTGKARSLSTDDLAKITEFKNIHFVNIQYGNVLKQVKEVKLLNGKDILRVPYTDLTQDISSVGSIINNCDLIITIDNTLAHLASSLGKPVWVLLPYSSDFRWMEDITPAIWYKNATLLRQKKENDWSNVIDLVCHALGKSEININN
ncbi:MAG: hypothetical protein CBC47_05630 [Alphaproteobacteria bacterium TMED87]|nr:MAG: hypothetical protein CBC47_05630 [Alphaproteobacteria bacterium TMED87]|tara:strand:- start:492 stop:1934 length:1443 start_codon:yes stop_codon:yes gene_type:complete